MEMQITTQGEATPGKGKSNAALVRELGELNARMGRLEERVEKNHASVIAEVQERIRRSKDQYLGWRIVGLVVALCGTVLLAVANLVS